MSSTDKAIYMNNFPHPIHGSLQPLRLGGESNLKEGETLSDAWDRMHKEAVEWIRTRIGGETLSASLYAPPPQYPFKHESVPIVEVEFRNGQQDTLDGIKACQTLEDLSTYRKLSSNNKELYDAYCLRLKQLTHADQTGDTR